MLPGGIRIEQFILYVNLAPITCSKKFLLENLICQHNLLWPGGKALEARQLGGCLKTRMERAFSP